MAENSGSTSTFDLTNLSRDQLWHLQLAFKYPRGRYGVGRASQLSGVPRRTLHDWARAQVYIPDFSDAYPKTWSYRDLVFLRIFAWLREKRMDRPEVSRRVSIIKKRLELESDAFLFVRSDGMTLLEGDQLIDELSGQQVFSEVVGHLDVFDLTAPVDVAEFRSHSRLWGPNLVKPSDRTAMSPWVMGGDPCIDQTRIPSLGVFVLNRQRGLDVEGIARLYRLEPAAIEDALLLENRLHQAA